MSLTPFDYFDISENDIPITQCTDCDYILKKAQRITQDFEHREITPAIESIHQLYRLFEVQFMETELPENEVVTYTPAMLIQHFMKTFDLTILPNLAFATWPQCYALLAAALIKDSCQKLVFWRDDSLSEHEKEGEQKDFSGGLVTEAMEAITKAEHLFEQENEKKKKSQQASKAVSTRYTASNSLKCEFVGFYFENAERYDNNKSRAARAFYKSLTDNQKATYKDERCAVRTLTKGLRDYGKEELFCSLEK